MNCEFLTPVNLGTEENPDFEFSELVCENETIELIEYDGKEFYVQKILTYGEGIIFWFLTIFLIGVIAKTIFNFFWKK